MSLGSLHSKSEFNSTQDAKAPALQNREAIVQSARERAMERLFQRRLESHADWEARREADRRDFLKGAALGSLMVVSFGTLAGQVRAQPGPASWTGLAALQSAAACAWENILFQSGHAALLALGQASGLPLANAALTAGRIERDDLRNTVELMERYPGIERKAYIHAGWFVPIREEIIFRVLPSGLLRSSDQRWDVGVPVSAAFAAMHNLVPVSDKTRTSLPVSNSAKLSLDFVPLPQFLFGAFCWHLARRYGELAPVLAHVAHNQYPALCLVWGGRGTEREFQRLVCEELSSGGPCRSSAGD